MEIDFSDLDTQNFMDSFFLEKLSPVIYQVETLLPLEGIKTDSSKPICFIMLGEPPNSPLSKEVIISLLRVKLKGAVAELRWFSGFAKFRGSFFCAGAKFDFL